MENKRNQSSGISPPGRKYDHYQRALAKLASLLRDRFLTARQIAAKTHCSRIQVYRRLAALRGTFVLTERMVREGDRGPLARAFRIG